MKNRAESEMNTATNEIDERDHQIIAMLRAEPTILNSRISAELGVSDATVSARIKKLKDIGMVRVVASTSIHVAGFESWAIVSARFTPGKQDTSETVAMKLAKIPQVTAIGTQMHLEQIMFHLIGRDAADIERLLSEIALSITAIESLESRIVLSAYKHSNNVGPIVDIVPDFEKRFQELSATRLRELFGEKELAVLAMLHGDGRLSLREVARRLDYPESQVRSVFRKLQNTPGVVNYQAIVNPRSLVNPYQSQLYIEANYRCLPSAIKALEALPEVSGLVTITGRKNLAVTIGSPARHTLHRLVTERIPAIKGIGEFEAINLHRGYKFEGSWTFPLASF